MSPAYGFDLPVRVFRVVLMVIVRARFVTGVHLHERLRSEHE